MHYDPHTLLWHPAEPDEPIDPHSQLSTPQPSTLNDPYPVAIHDRGFSLVADHEATLFASEAEAIQAIRKITSLGGARGGHFEIIRCLTPLEKAKTSLALAPRPGHSSHTVPLVPSH